MAKNRSNIYYAIIIVLGLAIIAALLYIIPFRYGINNTVTYTSTDEPLNNPLTGYAPPAENVGECEDSRLVYISLTWAEWEPQEGVYDVEGMVKKFHIDRWKNEHKHAVLRFVCDVPDRERHMDIPDWLYRQTRDGAFYENSYGQGYCPDYSNEYFRERHSIALLSLANYCNQDDFVSYVELGSLGHWGEWHIQSGQGLPRMPDGDVCNQYVLDYSDSFLNARLLVRRNYEIAVDGGLGLYNDMAGDVADTEEWLGWLQDGGSYETAGAPLYFEPVGRFWEKAPVGGEFTSGVSIDELLGRQRLQDTLETIEKSHLTFLGPCCPTGEAKDSEAGQKIRERLGYRLYISQLITEYSFAENCVKIYLTWKNTGLAPFYFNWPVTLYLYNMEGELKYWETINLDLRELVPNETIETVSSIPFSDLFRKGYHLGIGISNADGDDFVRLAMEGEERDGVRMIYTFVDQK